MDIPQTVTRATHEAIARLWLAGVSLGGGTPAQGSFAEYVQALYSLELAWLPFFRKEYKRADVDRMVDLVSDKPIDRAALRAIIKHESSGGLPVGVYAASAAEAIKADSSAYGVCQVTRTTWYDQSVKGAAICPHYALLHPWYGLVAGLRVWQAKVRASGGDTTAAWNSYAGTPQAGAELAAMFNTQMELQS